MFFKIDLEFLIDSMPMPAASLVEKLPDEAAACLFKHLDRTSRHNIARTSRGMHSCILKQVMSIRGVFLWHAYKMHSSPSMKSVDVSAMIRLYGRSCLDLCLREVCTGQRPILMKERHNNQL